MHFLVLGGNGETGQIVVDDALQRKHTITALVRDPSKLEARPGLAVVRGTPLNIDDMRIAFSARPVDAVLVTLGASRASRSPLAKSLAPPRLMADSVKNAVVAMREHGVKRLIIMQAFGVGSSFGNNNFLVRWMFSHTEMAKQMVDHNLVDVETKGAARKGGLEFTILRPAMLKGEELLPVKVLGDDGEGASFMPQISRHSVARFMLEDCAEKGAYRGRTPVICN